LASHFVTEAAISMYYDADIADVNISFIDFISGKLMRFTGLILVAGDEMHRHFILISTLTSAARRKRRVT
jgi:hypothetical protein